tara:strand:- start:57714 stop:58871 length:1158 start_codon:yes stop_codon:yes gene_type:complete
MPLIEPIPPVERPASAAPTVSETPTTGETVNASMVISPAHYQKLLERFNALALANEPTHPRQPVSLTQDDMIRDLPPFQASAAARSHSAPDPFFCISAGAGAICMSPKPFVFMYDSTASRATTQAIRSAGGVRPFDIEDPALHALFDTFSSLCFEKAVEKYVQYAIENKYSHEKFAENFQYFHIVFGSLGKSQLVDGLKIIHHSEFIPRVTGTFLSDILSSLKIDMNATDKTGLLRQIYNKKETVWELVNRDGLYMRQPLSPSEPMLNLPSGKCQLTLVIVEHEGKKKIWIGQGHHATIARGKKMVFFAGNIFFDAEGNIEKIDDASGGFHGLEAENAAVKELRKEQLGALLEQVGLPADKFEPAYTTAPVKPKLTLTNSRSAFV